MKSSLFLFVYSILKAFLPFPSLEAVLLPLCLMHPQYAFFYALLSGIGTCIGGHIGYLLAFHYGKDLVLKMISEKELNQGIIYFQKKGYLAVILGSITPFPDFILAYLAGILKMNPWIFLLLDGGCRFIRSLIFIYFSAQLNHLFHLDRYITILSIFIMVYFVGKYVIQKIFQH